MFFSENTKTAGILLGSCSLKIERQDNKVRLVKSVFCVLLFVSSLVIASTVTAGAANAASVYDSAYVSTSFIDVTDSTGVKHDITTNWSQYITDSSIPGHDASLASSYSTALSSGRWGVSQVHYQWHDYVFVYWTEDASLQVNFTTDNGGHRNVVASSTTADFCYQEIGDMPWISATTIGALGGGCYAPSTGALATQGVSSDNGAGAWAHNLFVNADYIYYPDGYAGNLIPAERLAPTTYYGTVDCGGDSVEYMLITQNGTTNAVPFSSYESIYRAHWSYDLTDTPYTITVGCGSWVAASFGSITPMSPSSNDWMCDTTGDLKYCIAA